LMQQPGFVRALVRKGDDATKVDWAHDSAWRFLPTIRAPRSVRSGSARGGRPAARAACPPGSSGGSGGRTRSATAPGPYLRGRR
jgi:hypothetical protein